MDAQSGSPIGEHCRTSLMTSSASESRLYRGAAGGSILA